MTISAPAAPTTPPPPPCKRPRESDNVKVKELNEHEPVSYVNKAGVKFTVTLVNPQVVTTFCPLCFDHVITANPICILSRYHVVCVECLPKICTNKSLPRCPFCNVDDSKADYEYIKRSSRDSAIELNGAKISCDTEGCSFTASFSDIEKHFHNVPSKSPLHCLDTSNETVNPLKGDIDEDIERIAESLTLQCPGIHGEDRLFLNLGASEEELAYVSSSDNVKKSNLPKAAAFKAKMVFTLEKRKKIKDPVCEDEMRDLFRIKKSHKTAESLSESIIWHQVFPNVVG